MRLLSAYSNLHSCTLRRHCDTLANQTSAFRHVQRKAFFFHARTSNPLTLSHPLDILGFHAFTSSNLRRRDSTRHLNGFPLRGICTLTLTLRFLQDQITPRFLFLAYPLQFNSKSHSFTLLTRASTTQSAQHEIRSEFTPQSGAGMGNLIHQIQAIEEAHKVGGGRYQAGEWG